MASPRIGLSLARGQSFLIGGDDCPLLVGLVDGIAVLLELWDQQEVCDPVLVDPELKRPPVTFLGACEDPSVVVPLQVDV